MRDDRADIPFPLSRAQSRLWFLCQYGGAHNGVYNASFALRFNGKLDGHALGHAFAYLAARHAALRTVFEATAGAPSQRTLASWRPKLEVQAVAADKLDAELAAAAQRDLGLMGGTPPWEVRLFEVDGTSQLLFLNLHHILCDGWSGGVLFRDLAEAYNAFLAGREPRLPALVGGYSDQVRFWQEQERGEDYAADLRFWEERLRGASPLEIPTDYPRPPEVTFEGDLVKASFGQAFLARLENFAAERHSTLFMTLLTALNVLFRRYGAGEDIVVGAPVANRLAEASEEQVGLYVNVLAQRTVLPGSPSFAEALAIVRDGWLESYARQATPLDAVVDALGVKRGASSSPLFQSMIALQNAWLGSALNFGGVQGKEIKVHNGGAMFDLYFEFDAAPGSLQFHLEYNTALFARATAERLVAHFKTLLERAVDNPDVSIDKLPMLSQAESAAQSSIWNGPARDYPLDKSPEELFEESARQRPDQVAARSEGKAVTYRELSELSSRVGARLTELGVEPGDLVAVCMGRSTDLIAVLLGVLKSGAGYLPLDPELPVARLEFMLQEACPRVLVTESALLDRLPGPRRASLLLDKELDALKALALPPPRPGRPDPESPAYVLYTSGSTGKPKGVMVPRRALTNLLLSMLEQPGLKPSDTMLALTTLSFDIAELELYLPLLAGATVHIVERTVAQDVFELIGLLQSPAVNVVQATPSHYKMLLDAGWTPDARFKLFCGGEALTAALAERLLQHGAELWNMYGPTETTVYSVIHQVKSAQPPILIGRPIANTQAYVLDKHLNPLPVGLPGVLYLGGAGLSKGYLNRLDITAERFVSNPQGQGLVYNTGDLARFLPDGSLQCLGRDDFQVKISGHRIELGEIASTLLRHGSVADAVVVARAMPDGGKRLAAYYLAKDQKDIDPHQLRSALFKELPDYMVPADYVRLESFPLTPSGKVDLKALPAPGVAVASGDFAVLSTTEEIRLATLWKGLLHCGQLGANSDFFASGGNSLLATRLIHKIQETFHVRFRIRDIFEKSTLAAQAAALQALAAANAPRPLPDTPFPLSRAQSRLWFLCQFGEGGKGVYNVPLALKLDGKLDVRALEKAMGFLAERHEVLRCVFDSVDGLPRQRILATTPFQLPFRPVGAAELDDVLAVEARRELSLESGKPPWEVQLFEVDGAWQLLFFNLHHILCDGWSIEVLGRDLAEAYNAFLDGRAPRLPELRGSYADQVSSWEAQEGSPEYAEDLRFWTERLRGYSDLAIPLDYPRPALASFDGDSVELDVGSFARFQMFSREHGATLFMTLLTTLNVLFRRYGAGEDIVVGAPVANRPDQEMDNKVGLFTNVLAQRTVLSGSPSFAEALAVVRDAWLEASSRQSSPLDAIIDALGVKRDSSRSPIFQTLLVLQYSTRQRLKFGAVEGQDYPVRNGGAKFDLTFAFEEADGSLRMELEYNTSLFARVTAERFAAHFHALLESAMANPGMAIDKLPMLTPAELKNQLTTWNDTARPYPLDKSPEALFEDVARQRPEQVAARSEGKSITYRELSELSSRIGARLNALGVGAGDLVAIYARRSTDLLAVLLGALKSGAGYLPLGPDLPAARLEFMLQDGRPKVLVTESDLLDKLPAHDATALLLDQELDGLKASELPPPSAPSDPESLAYVLYTSGSTGKPKGVLVPRRALTNLLLSMLERPGLKPSDTMLALTTLSFDIAELEMYLPLLAGATVHIAERGVALDPFLLIDLIAKQHINVVQATPSHYKMLLDAGWEPDARLRLFCGGEALNAALAERLLARGAELWNMYGPTETTVYSVIHPVKSAQPPILIGKPIANTQVHVLDKHLNPLPAGAPGVLYIGGAGLAQGYLNRPETTAERFVPNPFGQGRLYNTGDLARFLSDGSLECLGRDDFQVKINGHRIELGEIEATLLRHGAVADAVVVARSDAEGRVRLVAYLKPQPGAQPENLRDFLAPLLPDYMVPAFYVMLDAFPLTPSGKVDRKALPEPSLSTDVQVAAYVAPFTPEQQTIRDIFSQVLGGARVGIKDNFFELGGDSLMTIQVIARLHQTGLEVAVEQIFKNPTAEQLAEVVRPLFAAGREGETPCMVQLQKGASGRPALFLAHTPPGDLLGYVNLVQCLDKELPVYGFQSVGLFDKAAAHVSVEAMASFYVELLLRQQPRGPYLLAGWCLGGTVAFEMACQMAERGLPVALLAVFESTGIPLRGLALTYRWDRLLSLLRMSPARWKRYFQCKFFPVKAAKDATADDIKFKDVGMFANRSYVRRMNLRATDRYRSRPYHGNVVVFKSENQDPSVIDSPDMGWRRVASSYEVVLTPGGHGAQLKPPNVQVLAKELMARIRAATA